MSWIIYYTAEHALQQIRKQEGGLEKKRHSNLAFHSLTFIALIYLIDEVALLIFNNPAKLLQLYAVINQTLQQIPTDIYLYLTGASTAILWAIICLIAFDNSAEGFLYKILSDPKTQAATQE